MTWTLEGESYLDKNRRGRVPAIDWKMCLGEEEGSDVDRAVPGGCGGR